MACLHQSQDVVDIIRAFKGTAVPLAKVAPVAHVLAAVTLIRGDEVTLIRGDEVTRLGGEHRGPKGGRGRTQDDSQRRAPDAESLPAVCD